MPSPLEPVPGAAQPKPNVRKTLDTTLIGTCRTAPCASGVGNRNGPLFTFNGVRHLT